MSAHDDKHDHWLARPGTVRWLWRIFGLVLGLAVAAQLFIGVHGHFGVDGWFGFNAAFGFLACVAMVLFAKVLGWLVKRPEHYYRDLER
ncbi:MAG: hypothetical protein PVI87_08465 [Gammaproteobacteria bacterium]|jgi:Na+/proline symporter